MSSVKDILSRKSGHVISVVPDTTVFDALNLMAEKNIGSVIVLSGSGDFLGIVTERDYSRKVVLKGKNSNTTQVSEIMTTDLPEVNPDDSIDHCMELMTVNNVRYLPVFVDKRLNGIISISDVIKETILSQQQTINHLDNYIHSS